MPVEVMDVLRRELSRELDLRRIGSGSSKHVHSVGGENGTAIVLFSSDMEGKDAVVEALLELFWSKLLHASGILPRDPDWRIFFYLEKRSIEFRAGCCAGGNLCANELAVQLADRIEQGITQCIEQLPKEPLVYCKTKRAYADMEQWLRQGKATAEQALLMLNQVQAQMRAMHTIAVVHGDIKTSNILIVDLSNGVGQLCDFALSNKDAFRKPCHAGEDPRWVARQGGTYQLNLDDLKETPLQYGIRNDWLGLLITTMRVVATLLCAETMDTSWVDTLRHKEMPFWHTNNATMDHVATLTAFVWTLVDRAQQSAGAHLHSIAQLMPAALEHATPGQGVA